MCMPFADVGELSMYYEIRGDGPPLLYIGGTGGDLRKQPNVFDSPLGTSFASLLSTSAGWVKRTGRNATTPCRTTRMTARG